MRFILLLSLLLTGCVKGFKASRYETALSQPSVTGPAPTPGLPSPNPTPGPTTSPTLTDFYVAKNGSDSNPGTITQPLATLTRARDFAALSSKTAKVPVRVYVREGTYNLAEPLVFQTIHSGSATSPISFIGYNGENVVLSGAVTVSGKDDCDWSQINIASVSGPNPYVMRCTLKGDARILLNQGISRIRLSQANAAFAITEMFIDGQRKTRSRHPNQDAALDVHYLDTATTECPGRCPYFLAANSSWGRLPADIVNGSSEIVFTKSWTQPRGLITALDNDNTRNGISAAALDPNHVTWIGSGIFNELAHLENHRSFIDSAGEWYFDETALTFDYTPSEGEDVTKEVFSFPVTNSLIQLKGESRASTVHDLDFKNITFEYSTWNYKNSAGTSAYYAFEQGACGLGGMIDGNFVSNIHVYNSNFRHYGENAISLGGSRTGICSGLDGMAENIGINGSNFDDGGGGAIRIDSKGSTSGYLKIASNKINYVGQIFADAIGIEVLSSPNVLVASNEVAHTTYTGISTGWQCRNTANEQMIVEANNVQDVMKRLTDGGAIYSHGSQGFVIGNYIKTVGENRFSDAKQGPQIYFQGIYLDDNGYYWNVSNTNSFGSPGASSILYKSTTDTIPSEFSGISTYYPMIWFCPTSNDGSSITVAPPPIQRTTCAVKIGDCPNKPEWAGLTTNDTYEDADVDQARCMGRAKGYSDYCGSTTPITASFYQNTMLIQTVTY